MDFFDDDATSASTNRDSASARTPPRRRTDRRRTRIQRIVILAAIIFVVVFALAWWARACQQNRKEATYREYFESVATAIDDSTALGKQLNQLVNNPTKYSRKQLVDKLGELSAKQDEIAVRADRLEAPEPLAAERAEFAQGMRVRADGFALLETAMLGILSDKEVKLADLTSLQGYFSGPDAYYMNQVYVQARNVMNEEGVTDVVVPTSTWYLTSRTFDGARLEEMLGNVGSSTKLTGIHGVALAGVSAQPGNVALAQNGTTDLTATADLGFEVQVQNQGDGSEENVKVTAQLKLPGGEVLTKTGSIATIASGQTQKVTIQGFAIPAQALSKVSTLRVTAGPVPGERVKANNTGQFKILLQLQ